MVTHQRHRSTLLLALIAVLSVVLAIAAINGFLDPFLELLLGR